LFGNKKLTQDSLKDVTLEIRDIITNLPDRVVIIFYNSGFRGHCVTRILGSHKESYWHSTWSLNPDSGDPLSFPEKQTHFTFPHIKKLPLKKTFPLVHTGLFFNINDGEPKKRLSEIAEINVALSDGTERYIFLNSHPDGTGLEYIKRHKKVVLYSSSKKDNRFLIDKDSFPVKLYNTLKPLDDALNIDIDALFSLNYKEFESEYIKIVRYFDFTPRINAVRAFILRYLERERYVFDS